MTFVHLLRLFCGCIMLLIPVEVLFVEIPVIGNPSLSKYTVNNRPI